jgi:hypothetical protein
VLRRLLIRVQTMLRVSGVSSGLSIVVAEIVLTHACVIGHSASTGMRGSCT